MWGWGNKKKTLQLRVIASPDLKGREKDGVARIQPESSWNTSCSTGPVTFSRETQMFLHPPPTHTHSPGKWEWGTQALTSLKARVEESRWVYSSLPLRTQSIADQRGHWNDQPGVSLKIVTSQSSHYQLFYVSVPLNEWQMP